MQRNRNIINFAFLKYTAQAVAKIATEGYKKDVASFKATFKKKKLPAVGPTKKQDPTSAANPTIAPKSNTDPDDIFTINERDKHTVLQSATLIHGLLHKNFSSTSSDLQQLQCSDLKLRNLHEKTKQDKLKSYVIISKILCRLGKNNVRILCGLDLLCRQIVQDSHSKSGFHFKVHQLNAILRPLIFHPNLGDLITHTVKHRLICNITPSKRVREINWRPEK